MLRPRRRGLAVFVGHAAAGGEAVALHGETVAGQGLEYVGIGRFHVDVIPTFPFLVRTFLQGELGVVRPFALDAKLVHDLTLVTVDDGHEVGLAVGLAHGHGLPVGHRAGDVHLGVIRAAFDDPVVIAAQLEHGRDDFGGLSGPGGGPRGGRSGRDGLLLPGFIALTHSGGVAVADRRSPASHGRQSHVVFAFFL